MTRNLPKMLSPNFSLAEGMVSQRAVRAGIDNTPPPEILDRMIRVSAPGMEQVKAVLKGYGVLVSSWYRCDWLNDAVNGSPAHPSGYAIDFTCPRFGTPLEVAKALAASGIEFDQLIHEFRSWVHISFDPRTGKGGPRRQLLTIDKRGTFIGLRA